MRSQADEAINRLPAGYHQMIGKRFKNGVEALAETWGDRMSWGFEEGKVYNRRAAAP